MMNTHFRATLNRPDSSAPTPTQPAFQLPEPIHRFWGSGVPPPRTQQTPPCSDPNFCRRGVHWTQGRGDGSEPPHHVRAPVPRRSRLASDDGLRGMTGEPAAPQPSGWALPHHGSSPPPSGNPFLGMLAKASLASPPPHRLAGRPQKLSCPKTCPSRETVRAHGTHQLSPLPTPNSPPALTGLSRVKCTFSVLWCVKDRGRGGRFLSAGQRVRDEFF